MAEIDPRLVQVVIALNGEQFTYNEGLDIKATGTKFANPLQNEASVEIANLSAADRNFILTATSPFNKNTTPKTLTLYAGRQSTGATKIYSGNISTSEVTQPADIILKIKCQENQFLKGNIISTAQPSIATLRAIAAQAAKDTGLILNFQATDKNISNYAFDGGALKQLDVIGAAGNVNAFVDGGQLFVKDKGVPLNDALRVIAADSGMVGIPLITAEGIKVTYMLDTTSTLGGELQVVSVIYPTASGNYVIFKLGFNITSRDDPFYWIAEAERLNASGTAAIPTNIKKKKGARR